MEVTAPVLPAFDAPEVRSFLEIVLAGDGFIEIRQLPEPKPERNDDPRRVESCYFTTTSEALDWLAAQGARLNQTGYALSFGPCRRTCRREYPATGRDEDVAAIPVLWADLDFKDFGPEKHNPENETRARAQLAGFPFPPSAIVASGGGLHCYWLLDKPIASELAKLVMMHLAFILGGDRNAPNVGRVLRVPGSVHRKDPAAPKLVRVERIDPRARYKLAALKTALTFEKRVASLADLASERTKKDIAALCQEAGQMPPLDRGDALRLLKTKTARPMKELTDASRQPQGRAPEPEFERGDDAELADKLLEQLQGDGPPLVTDLGELHRYDRAIGIWPALHRATAISAVKSMAGKPVIVGLEADGSPTIRSLNITKAKTDGALALAMADTSRPGFFSERVLGVAFANCFVSVSRDGVRISEHSPDHRCRWSLPFGFDEDAPCERAMEHFAAVFAGTPDAAELVDILGEFAGAALFGLATRYRKALVLFGPLAFNGKSETLKLLQGPIPEGYTTCIPPQQLGDEYYRAKLAGSLLNLVDELPAARILDCDPLKTAISGGPLDGRHPAGRPFSFTPTAAHIFSCNRLPMPKDVSDGFFSRWIVMPFRNRFEGKAETEIASKILASERPGLAAWAVRGAVRLLQQNGYTRSASCDRELAKWRTDADQVREFLEACTVEDMDNPTLSSDLYRVFRVWAPEAGHQGMSEKEFYNRLTIAFGRPAKHTNRGEVRPVAVVKEWRARAAAVGVTLPPLKPAKVLTLPSVRESEGK